MPTIAITLKTKTTTLHNTDCRTLSLLAPLLVYTKPSRLLVRYIGNQESISSNITTPLEMTDGRWAKVTRKMSTAHNLCPVLMFDVTVSAVCYCSCMLCHNYTSASGCRFALVFVIVWQIRVHAYVCVFAQLIAFWHSGFVFLFELSFLCVCAVYLHCIADFRQL